MAFDRPSEDNFNVEPKVVQRLSRRQWKQVCECRSCAANPLEHTAPYWAVAYQYWLTARNEVCGF